jgi:hypothetical protein
MKVDLTEVEATFLAFHLRRRMQWVEWELARTDKRQLQRELAVDLEALEQLVARFEGAGHRRDLS